MQEYMYNNMSRQVYSFRDKSDIVGSRVLVNEQIQNYLKNKMNKGGKYINDFKA